MTWAAQDYTLIITATGSVLGIIGGLLWPARQHYLDRRNDEARGVRDELRSAIDGLIDATSDLEGYFELASKRQSKEEIPASNQDRFNAAQMKFTSLAASYGLDAKPICETMHAAAHCFLPMHSEKFGWENVFEKEERTLWSCMKNSKAQYSEATSLIDELWRQVDVKYPRK
ncbi:hypothetical protein E0K93_12490 [Puniceibacterium sp. HSS470]|uniref:hypothetical protein n=1 Tax=Pseudooceanicola sediminis TaxID=2211117 RepID=UPI0011C3E144|nr:hypothetical protein [Pseudooceanicola sediminis]KAA2313919.1 hypothetical protein E0K93_12490 [Puniceibacterium sp. HSS470]